VIDIEHSKIYLSPEDYEIVKEEEPYVQKRYFIIALMFQEKPFGLSRADGAKHLHLSKRHVYRLIRRFREEGIPGLRNKSTRPKTIPNISPEWIEDIVVNVRENTGFSPQDISSIMNEAAKIGSKKIKFRHSTVNKILKRNGYYGEKPPGKKKWKSFDWKKPDHLVQSDWTYFNNVPILTMEDDHSREGWAMDVSCVEAPTLTACMHILHPKKIDNLLVDNARQFRLTNSHMREYCDHNVTGRLIHTSIRHPQTMGKLSQYQKKMKRFLYYRLGESKSRQKIRVEIRTWNLWYNNGKYHSVIKGCPEMLYSGKTEKNWYLKLIKRLKLEEVLKPLLCG
jgi:transposase